MNFQIQVTIGESNREMLEAVTQAVKTGIMRAMCERVVQISTNTFGSYMQSYESKIIYLEVGEKPKSEVT